MNGVVVATSNCRRQVARSAIRAVAAIAGVVVVLVFAPAALALSPPHIYCANQTELGTAILDGTVVNQSLIAGADNPYWVAVSVPVAELSPGGAAGVLDDGPGNARRAADTDALKRRPAATVADRAVIQRR